MTVDGLALTRSATDVFFRAVSAVHHTTQIRATFRAQVDIAVGVQIDIGAVPSRDDLDALPAAAINPPVYDHEKSLSRKQLARLDRQFARKQSASVNSVMRIPLIAYFCAATLGEVQGGSGGHYVPDDEGYENYDREDCPPLHIEPPNFSL